MGTERTGRHDNTIWALSKRFFRLPSLIQSIVAVCGDAVVGYVLFYVAQYEELRNEEDYQRARLAGSLLKSGRVSSGATKYAEAFQNQASDEKRRQIAELLNRCFANPDRYECHFAESEEGKPLALHILDTSSPHVIELPIFRLSQNVLNTRLALTLTRTLLAEIIKHALSRGVTAVKIVDRNMSQVVVTALRSAGFFKTGNFWLKLSIPACLTPTKMTIRVCEIADSLAISYNELQHLITTVAKAQSA